MPTDPLPLPIARLHNNRQRFSDHLLNVILRGRPHWRFLLKFNRNYN
jgi:hypothetical protein